MSRKVLDLIVQGLACELVNQQAGLEVSTVVIDSRLAGAGSLFVACDGEHVDGHDFVVDAFERGASAAVIDAAHPQAKDLAGYAVKHGKVLIRSDSPRQTLGDMAAKYRAQLTCTVIGITGSSGKTTTKSLMPDLLRAKYRVAASPKNFNNDLGVPLCIFEIDAEDEVAILEMGMNHAGELTRLAEIARPDMAVITNIGDAHIEFFKDRKAIALAKKEIFAYFNAGNIAILNRDDPFFDLLAEGLSGEIISFTKCHGFSVVEDHGIGGYTLRLGKSTVLFPMGGEHNLYNVSAAIAAAQRLSLTESDLAGALNRVRNVDARTTVVSGRHTIIDDTYNANPDSMRAALRLLAKKSEAHDKRPRIAVLGDMFELGGQSDALHAELGCWISEHAVCNVLVTVGAAMQHCAAAADADEGSLKVVAFNSTEEAGEWLRSNIREEAVILLKGSRGMRMERILPFVTYDV